METTGAKAPTLYAEFINKEELSRAVLDRYITCFAAKHEAQLLCEEKSLESALEDYSTTITTCSTSRDTPAGYFMINTFVTSAASSCNTAHMVKSRHAVQEQTLTQFSRQRQQRGEIPAHCDVRKLAEHLDYTLQGMSISAREDMTFEKLTQIAYTTPCLWPEPVKV